MKKKLMGGGTAVLLLRRSLQLENRNSFFVEEEYR
jgi:hypothetical protein